MGNLLMILIFAVVGWGVSAISHPPLDKCDAWVLGSIGAAAVIVFLVGWVLP